MFFGKVRRNQIVVKCVLYRFDDPIQCVLHGLEHVVNDQLRLIRLLKTETHVYFLQALHLNQLI